MKENWQGRVAQIIKSKIKSNMWNFVIIMISKIIVLVLALISCVLTQILSLDKTVLNQIYQQQKVYIVYVHGNAHKFQIESVFNSYCFGEKLCAVLEPNNPDYYNLLQFIGYTQIEYFLILDAASKRKYVLPVPQESFTTNDLLSFQYKYLYKELQPFFSSQSQPNEFNLRCTKLVGTNLGEFLRRAERVKVVLLYNLNENCPTCDHILQIYMPFAQRHYEEAKVAFGYFNTFLNDHPTIQDQKTPSFIIFVDQQYQSPFVLEAESLEGLSLFLQKMIGKPFKETKNSKKIQIEPFSEKDEGNEL